MKRLPTVIACLAAISIIVAIACTETKVPTTSSEISDSFSALAQLFSAEQQSIEANASTADKLADDIATNPEAMAFARHKAKNGKENERAAAASILARIDNPKAVNELCGMVEDDSPDARREVYVALKKHNTPEARQALTRAIEIHGLEDQLTEVVCDVMDEEMWASTSKIIFASTEGLDEIINLDDLENLEVAERLKMDFDPEAIRILIKTATEREFSTEHFDHEEFAEKMKEWALKMKERFGDDSDATIKIEVEEHNTGPEAS